MTDPFLTTLAAALAASLIMRCWRFLSQGRHLGMCRCNECLRWRAARYKANLEDGK